MGDCGKAGPITSRSQLPTGEDKTSPGPREEKMSTFQPSSRSFIQTRVTRSWFLLPFKEPHALVLQADVCPPMSPRAPRSRAGACLGALFQIYSPRPRPAHRLPWLLTAQASPVNDDAHAGRSLAGNSLEGTLTRRNSPSSSAEHAQRHTHVHSQAFRKEVVWQSGLWHMPSLPG